MTVRSSDDDSPPPGESAHASAPPADPNDLNTMRGILLSALLGALAWTLIGAAAGLALQ